MKYLSIFLVFSLLVLIASCSSISVKHDYDREANFASLKTFDWMSQPKAATGDAQRAMAINTLLDSRIRSAVSSQLTAKGLTQASGNPDFMIVYHTGVQDKIEVTDWGYTYARGGRYWGWAGHDIDVHSYKQGTLILDFVDAKSKQLIWRGVAQKAIETNPTPEKIEKNVNQAVTKMLEKFPPVPST